MTLKVKSKNKNKGKVKDPTLDAQRTRAEGGEPVCAHLFVWAGTDYS